MSREHSLRAEQFLAERMTFGGVRTLHYHGGDFWLWDGAAYRPESKDALRHVLLRWLTSRHETSESRVRDEVWESVKAILGTEAPPTMPQWLIGGEDPKRTHAEQTHEFLRWKNGLLDVTALAAGYPGGLLPNTPRWFSRTVLPVTYDPRAPCPLFLGALDEWMCGDQELVAFLQEYIGYCLVPDTAHGIALFLEGEGSNGKSTFCELLGGLFGRDNYSAVPLEQWSELFPISTTMGKLVNFSSETEGKKALPTTALKRFITGDTFTFRRMYQTEGITQRPTARLVISWNRRPMVTDGSDGFWRRVRLVPWRRQFSVEGRDEYLLPKLTAELPGVANWAVEGLCRLRRNGKFTDSVAVRTVTQGFREHSDPARAFGLASFEGATDHQVRKADAYAALAEWCEDHALETPSPETFAKTVFRLFPGVSPGRIREGAALRVQVFNNLKWKGRDS